MKRLLLAYGILFFGSPGLIWSEGSVWAAVLGLALWSDAVRHRGRRPRLCEWLFGGLYGAAIMGWAALVWWPTLIWIGVGFGLYLLVAGWLARRLSGRFPVAVATAIAWVGIESLRTVLPTPLGLSWIRIGHHAMALPWLAGSVRVVGVAGVTFAIAAAAGGLAECVRARRIVARESVAGALPLLALLVLAAVTGPPEMRDGPRVMMVQPAFEQDRKRHGDPRDNHFESLRLTAEGLAEAAREGEPTPDLVMWGESMVGMSIREPSLLEALEAGMALPEDREGLADPGWVRAEEDLILLPLFGRRTPEDPRHLEAILPEGTAWLAGAETYAAINGELAHLNSVVLWDATGKRDPGSPKQFLVPGAETMLGLEKLDWVARINVALGNYVPDFTAGEETGIFEFETRSGQRFRGGATVCFDNAYLAPYLGPFRQGRDLDFHAVASNEAWYELLWEAEQMMAFSRAIAIATGRSVVRAANSGISAVVGPDGSVLSQLEVDGETRMVRGTLRTTVPVPVPGAGSPPFARWSRYWTGLWLLLPLLACALAKSGRYPAAPAG